MFTPLVEIYIWYWIVIWTKDVRVLNVRLSVRIWHPSLEIYFIDLFLIYLGQIIIFIQVLFFISFWSIYQINKKIILKSDIICSIFAEIRVKLSDSDQLFLANFRKSHWNSEILHEFVKHFGCALVIVLLNRMPHVVQNCKLKFTLHLSDS